MAFFHSKSPAVGGAFPENYWVGAFTFSIHLTEDGALQSSRRFILKSISSYPIVDRKWYSGKWYREGARQYGYIVWPMGLTLIKSEEEPIVVLSLSTQERSAYLITFRLTRLLDSLKNITCS